MNKKDIENNHKYIMTLKTKYSGKFRRLFLRISLNKYNLKNIRKTYGFRKWTKKISKDIDRHSKYKFTMKQKLRRYYGNLRDKSFEKLYRIAFSYKGEPIKNFFKILEKRLDTLLSRSYFSYSIYNSRQLINHGHVLVNGKIIKNANYIIEKGDLIQINQNYLHTLANFLYYYIKKKLFKYRSKIRRKNHKLAKYLKKNIKRRKKLNYKKKSHPEIFIDLNKNYNKNINYDLDNKSIANNEIITNFQKEYDLLMNNKKFINIKNLFNNDTELKTFIFNLKSPLYILKKKYILKKLLKHLTLMKNNKTPLLKFYETLLHLFKFTYYKMSTLSPRQHKKLKNKYVYINKYYNDHIEKLMDYIWNSHNQSIFENIMELLEETENKYNLNKNLNLNIKKKIKIKKELKIKRLFSPLIIPQYLLVNYRILSSILVDSPNPNFVPYLEPLNLNPQIYKRLYKKV